MTTPRVSILLPCLNARPFLEARVDSLLAQDCTAWEAIVLDSHSDDGSWEFFEAAAARDGRFRLHQLPREGLYAALNHGITLARGEFLHIATCDDTMEPAFLSTLLAALVQMPAAGIAVCDVRFIDAHGADTVFNTRLGSACVRASTVAEVRRDLNYRPPPHDCLLHFAGETVYCSLTQLVVRTALARAAPHFETRRGSIADFGWSLNLANLAGTVHVPQRLATWRIRDGQISAAVDPAVPGHIAAMCRSGLSEVVRVHPALLSSQEKAALLLPTRLLHAQATGRRSRQLACYLEAGLRLLALCAGRPAASLRALTGASLRRRHLKQGWVAFILRRLDLRPKTLP